LPYTEAHNDGSAGGGGGKKKKVMIGGGVGLLAIVAIVLIIVFATKKSGSDGGDRPKPDPGPGPDPPTPDGFNPFYMDPSEQLTTVDTQEGVLLFNTSFPKMEEFTAKSGEFLEDDMAVGVNSHNVAASLGVNNNFIERVRYAFGQASYKRTVLSLTDDKNERFDIPDDLVAKQTGQYQYRLDMVDFHFQPDPFTF
jgi:hypothetical protein